MCFHNSTYYSKLLFPHTIGDCGKKDRGKTFAFVFLRSLLYKAELRFSFRLIRPASQGGYAPFFGCPRPRFSFNGSAAQSADFRILAVYLISAVGTLSQPMQEIWPGRDMVMTPL